jgi:hypothetical protein
VTLGGCRLRQLYVLDLGHEKPEFDNLNWPHLGAK